jgi:GNAT superfamily N-acetyltransferase
MIPTAYPELSLVSNDVEDREYHELLRQKLRDYNRRAAPGMEAPDARPLNIQVVDDAGNVIGGLAGYTYWGWLVIRLLVLDERQRGNGIGMRLMKMAHDEARARGCARVQAMTYDFQALEFYLKQGYEIVGKLPDYPDGYDYYWLCKDLQQDA